jgi:hypothetical protein
MVCKILPHTLAREAASTPAFEDLKRANMCEYGLVTVITSHVPRVAVAASRRSVLRGLTSAASALALCGCAGTAADSHFDASALVLNPMLLVATTRKPVNGARGKPWFGTERRSPAPH